MNDNEQESIVREIRSKYVQDPMLSQLRTLDAKVHRPVYVFSYAYGIAGFILLVIGAFLAINDIQTPSLLGVVIGLIGLAMVCSTYTIYKGIVKVRRAKHAAEVLDLCNKIMNE